MRAIVFSLFLAVSTFVFSACGALADNSGPTHLYVLGFDADAWREISGSPDAEPEALASAVEVIRSRFDASGKGAARVEANGAGQIVISIPFEHDRDDVLDLLGIGTKLEFGVVVEEVPGEAIAPDDTSKPEPSDLPDGTRILPMPDELTSIKVQIVKGLDGSRLESARAGLETQSNSAVVHLSFDAEGKRLFGELTTANVGQRIAVILDGKVITAPIVHEPILGGQVQISGNFTQKSANELAIQLASGSLPVPLVLIEERVSEGD